MKLQFCVARLVLGPRPKTAELSLRFRPPSQELDIIPNDPVLVSFCYPLGPESQAPKEYMAPEEYTFTLTQGTGERVQGFCRRFLPPAPVKATSKLRYPQVICLLAEAPWNTFFFKVLQIIEQLLRQSQLLLAEGQQTLPPTSLAGRYLLDVAVQLAASPTPGHIIRCSIPGGSTGLSISPPRRLTIGGVVEPPLQCTSDYVELQIPPDCGNGTWNCGVSMARLLWHVPVPAMLTLIASMLLERRVILVSQSRDMVSAAVNAAHAFLYPFRWHHIYLPLLPRQLKDYLTAPMPFLIGMPAQLLPILKGIPMNEVTMIDLDLGKCEPAPGSEADDALTLPWCDRLEHALTEAKENLRSPTEYESNPFIAGIMLEYYLKLMGNYRKFSHENPRPTNLAGGGSTSEPSTPSGRASLNKNGLPLDALVGPGYYFDHAAFVAGHRGGEKARRFLNLFRHSQMYEMFMQERLALARDNYPPEQLDSFELRVTAQFAKRNRMKRITSRLNAEYKRAASKVAEVVRQAHAGVERMLADTEDPAARRANAPSTNPMQVGAGSLAAQYELVSIYFKDDDSDGDSETSLDVTRSSPSTHSLPDLSSSELRPQALHSTNSTPTLAVASAPLPTTKPQAASGGGWATNWGSSARPHTPTLSERSGRSSTSEHDPSPLINMDESEGHHSAPPGEPSGRQAPSLSSILDGALGGRTQPVASSSGANPLPHPLASTSTQPSHPLQRTNSINGRQAASVPPIPLQYTGGGTPVPASTAVTELWSNFRADISDAWHDFSSAMGTVAANVRQPKSRPAPGVTRSDSYRSSGSDSSRVTDPFSGLVDLGKHADKPPPLKRDSAPQLRQDSGTQAVPAPAPAARPTLLGGAGLSASFSDRWTKEPQASSVPGPSSKPGEAAAGAATRQPSGPVHHIIATADPLGAATLAHPLANGVSKPWGATTSGATDNWDPFDVLAATGPSTSAPQTQQPRPQPVNDPLAGAWDPFATPAPSSGYSEASWAALKPEAATGGGSAAQGDADPFGLLATQSKLGGYTTHAPKTASVNLIDL